MEPYFKIGKGNIVLLLLLVCNIALIFLNLYSINVKKPPVLNTEKIEKIVDKVIARDVIEDTYLLYINDENLRNYILKYNEKTADLKVRYKLYATETVFTLCELDLTTAASGYREIPDDIKEIINKISTYALYRNAPELILSDADINQIIAGEIGGSYGAWPWHIHEEALENEMENYFILVDKIIEALSI